MPSSFNQQKHSKRSFDPLISLPISPERLGDTFRGMLEGYFGETVFVLGQSSAKLYDMKCKECMPKVDPDN